MELILDGIKMGLVLTFLIGPLFFALIQTGVEQGYRAGIVLAFGIWVSDFMYIFTIYHGITFFANLIKTPNFSFWLGLVGSVLLTSFGIGSLIGSPKGSVEDQPKLFERSASYPSLFFKGFLINTINPFTIFFWMGLMSTVAIKDHFSTYDAQLFFGAILATLVITDALKVGLAKWIRHVLKVKHIIWLRRITGIALIVFGVALLIRVVMMK
jgi:threonine/homoserine/homoserine lactone efflux protein